MMRDNRVDKIMARFKKAKEKRQEREKVWNELDAFDRNKQWDLENAPPWVPKPVTNFVHVVKYTKRAALAVDNPVGKLRPVSPEGVERVKKLNQAFRFVWDRIKARKVVRENIETGKLLGDGIAHVYWNEFAEGKMGSTIQGDEGYAFEGEIGIKEIDPSAFYPDPDAFSLQECRYIHIVERKNKDDITTNPKFKNVNLDKIDSTNSPADRGEVYNRDYDTKHSGEIIDFHSHYERIPNNEGGYTYKVTYLAGDKILASEDLSPNRYPFAVYKDFPQRHSFWSMSTCEFILDNQKVINKVESIITMIGTLMQNQQRIVAQESGIDPAEVGLFGSAPGYTFAAHGDPSRAIHYVDPPSPPPILFNLLENAKENIREITGLTQAYLGQSVGSLQTSSGVNSLIERATMRDRDQMYDLELYIEDLTNLIIDFMVTYYNQPRLVRILGDTPDTYSFMEFVGTEYANLDYDVFVDVSASAPITRLREAQEAKDLIALQGQYGAMFSAPLITGQELIEKLNLTDKDIIIRRMQMDEIRNKTEEAMKVAQMMAEATENGVDPSTVLDMGMKMFEQIEQEGKGMGSTANANAFQASQGAPSGGMQ